ncbi:unnamed protein product, partial [Amoebophrya sp. A120]
MHEVAFEAELSFGSAHDRGQALLPEGFCNDMSANRRDFLKLWEQVKLRLSEKNQDSA